MGISRLFLTPSEVAKELQLNLLTIYKYIRNKKLLAIKIKLMRKALTLKAFLKAKLIIAFKMNWLEPGII